MSDSVVPRRLDAVASRVSTTAIVLAVLAILAELALLAAYVGITDANVTSARYLLYPFVWINLGMWAVFAVTPVRATTRTHAVVAVATGAYFLLLAYFGGLLDVSHVGHFHSHGGTRGLSVFTALPPGWGPTLVYEHDLYTVTLVPYKLVGYLALTYLVYVALLDTVAAAVSGAIGLLSCVSCSWPVLASLLAGVVGGSTAATTVYSFSIDLSTAAFVAAVVLLVWRPGTRQNQ